MSRVPPNGSGARALTRKSTPSRPNSMRARPGQASARAIGMPIKLFTAGYMGFLAVLWIPFSTLIPDTMRSLSVSARLFGYTPPLVVISLYSLGLLMVWVGYLVGRPMVMGLAPPSRSLEEESSTFYKVAPPAVGLCILAYIAQIYLLGTLPLINLSARWELSAKLVTVISMLVPISASAVAIWGWTRRTQVLVAGSLIIFATLGGRLLPLTLVVAVLVTMALTGTRRQVRRALRLSAVGVLLVSATVGVVSKTAIYSGSSDSSYDPLKAVALFQTDSIGTFYNLTGIYDRVTFNGQSSQGRMLRDTVLNLAPGQNRDYSNYQLGQLVQGRSSVIVGGQTINRSVSLSGTVVGAPFADGGWLGVGLFTLFLGAAWALFEEVALRIRWFIGFYAFWLAQVFSSIYSGAYNHLFIIATALCFTLILGSLAARTKTTRGPVRRAPQGGSRSRRASEPVDSASSMTRMEST